MANTNPTELWVQEKPALLNYAFNNFMATGEWPQIAATQRYLATQGIKDLDVRAYVDAKPRFLSEQRTITTDTLRLNIRQLQYVPNAGPLIQVCLAATREAYKSYVTEGQILQVSSDNLAVVATAGGNEQLISRAGTLLFNEHPGPTGGGNPPHRARSEWMFHVNESVILGFDGVFSAADFVARQDALLQKDVELFRARMGPPAEPEPIRIFVVMPFSEPWSDAVHAAIQATVHDWDDKLRPLLVRVDQVRRSGRLSLRIIEEIKQSDVVVADLTGRNGNVLYEVGWAHAYDKPTIFLNQDIDDSPFDVKDYVQIKYESDNLAHLTSELALYLEAEITALQ